MPNPPAPAGPPSWGTPIPKPLPPAGGAGVKAWQKWAAGLGLGAGALWWLMRKGGDFPVGLCTGHHYLDEPGGRDAIAATRMAIALKLGEDASTWQDDTAPVIAWARAAGCDASTGWGWHSLNRFRNPAKYSTDAESGIAEGTAAAKGCLDLGISNYYCNLERDCFGGEGQPKPADVDSNIAVFVSAFRSAAPSVKLGFTGYVTRAKEATRALFDIWAPMIYGTPSHDTAAVRTSQWDRWARNAHAAAARGQPFCPISSPGAVSGGRAWDYQLDGDGAPGLISRVAAFQPAGVWWWYWGEAEQSKMLTRGSSANAPLATAAGWVREAKAAGSSWAGTAAAGMVVPGSGSAPAGPLVG